MKNIEDKIPDITYLATTTAFNAKIKEVKNEIPSIINLATTTALAAIENKIANVSNLIQNILKIKLLLIMIMINMLLLKNLIINIRKYCCKISKSKFSKQK